MPTVPAYNPVPQASQMIATPNRQVSTPVEAFGGATAQALGHLGSVAQHVGDEIYARARALQDLQNETEATDADTKYMIASADAQAQFGALEGEAKAKAFPGHVEGLQKLREEIGKGLSNPMSRKLYDNSSKRFMGREIFNSAGQAATAQKHAAIGASTARVEAAASTITNPLNEDDFNARIDLTTKELERLAIDQGWSEDEKNNRLGKQISALWRNRIEILSRTAPLSAQQMMEKNKDKLRESDWKVLEPRMQAAMRGTYSRIIAEVTNAGWGPYMTQTDIDRASGVEEPLLRIVKEAQRANPEIQFTIGGEGGRRTAAQQTRLVALGRSQTYNSDHLRGTAIDLVPLGPDGKPNYKDKEGLAKIETAMMEASQRLGIPLQPKSKSFTSWDPYHFSLGTGYDPKSAPKAVEEPLSGRVERAKDYARKINPDDSVFADYVEQRVIADHTRTLAIKRDSDFRAKNTVDGAIVGAFGSGKLPTTVEELKSASPEVAAAWDSLDESKQRAYLGYLAKNAKGESGWTQEGLRRYRQLIGLSNSDPAEFLNTDVIGENVPNSAKRELVKLQEARKQKAEGDPRVRQAMQLLLPILGPADLARRTDSNKDRYDQYVGALQDQIELFTRENKTPPKNKDIQEIGARLLQEQSTPGWLFGNIWPNKNPLFNIPVPEKDEERIKASPLWAQRGVTPTPEMIRRVYAAEQYQKLYGKPLKAEGK